MGLADNKIWPTPSEPEKERKQQMNSHSDHPCLSKKNDNSWQLLLLQYNITFELFVWAMRRPMLVPVANELKHPH